jgi:hypothetical protein
MKPANGRGRPGTRNCRRSRRWRGERWVDPELDLLPPVAGSKRGPQSPRYDGHCVRRRRPAPPRRRTRRLRVHRQTGRFRSAQGAAAQAVCRGGLTERGESATRRADVSWSLVFARILRECPFPGRPDHPLAWPRMALEGRLRSPNRVHTNGRNRRISPAAECPDQGPVGPLPAAPVRRLCNSHFALRQEHCYPCRRGPI